MSLPEPTPPNSYEREPLWRSAVAGALLAIILLVMVMA